MARAYQYSEKIVFSEDGIRMAVLEENGKVTHHDNWTLDLFGGVLPIVGDYVTTLWDPRKPEPAESYIVLERHWIGELKGDNCWWLLLKPVQPTETQRALFKVARKHSAETRARERLRQPKLTPGESFRKMLEARKTPEQAKKNTRKPAQPKPQS